MQIGLKLISLIKVIRGIGAISLATSLFWASQQPLPELGERLSRYEFLYAIAKSIGLISGLLSNLTQSNLLGLSVLALLLSIIRFSEAAGIWLNQSWAQWLAVLTGVVTAIFFLQQMLGRYEQSVLIMLLLNILVVTYLLWVLLIKKKKVLEY